MSTPAFRHYDRAALDKEYDNRGKVADFPDYLTRFETSSVAARESLEGRLGVAFGPSVAETLDIFPASPGAPVHVFIHGGYWKALSKDEFSFVARGLVPRGATTVVINYGLIPEISMDELVRQCRAALAWVWRNASSFGGDRERIFVSGHSAGGHLTAMIVATDWPTFDPELPADLVKGACAISGLHDLEPIRLCFLNDDLQLSEATAARNSPILLPRHSHGPLLLPVGELEGPEYLRQSQDLAQAWHNVGRPPELMVMPGIHHFSIVAQLDDPDSDLSVAIQNQMGL